MPLCMAQPLFRGLMAERCTKRWFVARVVRLCAWFSRLVPKDAAKRCTKCREATAAARGAWGTRAASGRIAGDPFAGVHCEVRREIHGEVRGDVHYGARGEVHCEVRREARGDAEGDAEGEGGEAGDELEVRGEVRGAFVHGSAASSAG